MKPTKFKVCDKGITILGGVISPFFTSKCINSGGKMRNVVQLIFNLEKSIQFIKPEYITILKKAYSSI